MDIDIDISSHKRDLAFQKVREFMLENGGDVVRVGTFKTESAKSAIQTACRGLGVPSDIGLYLSSMIPVVRGNTRSLHDTYYGNEDDDIPPVTEFVKEIDKYEDLFETALGFEGLISGRSCHACFKGDERVETIEGLKPIKEVKIGDKVLTHTNTYKEVVDVMSHKTDDTYKVRATGMFETTVTGNHPYYVRKRGKKGKYSASEPQWVEVKKIQLGDYIGQAINTESVIPQGELPFSNKDFWWLVGRFVGDGWLEAPQRKGKQCIWDRRVLICCSKVADQELKDITSVIDRLGFDYRVETSRTTYKVILKYVGNEHLYDYLESFGKYAHGKYLNGDVIRLPKDLLGSFLEGYMSADGHYYSDTNYYSLKTVSKDLALGVQHMVAKLYNRYSTVTILPPKEEVIEGRLVLSKEKYEVKYKQVNHPYDKCFYENGYLWCPVKRVEKIDEFMEVYNLTVLDDSSYSVNRAVVHNCGIIPSFDLLSSCATMKAPSGETITQYDLGDCELSGLIKYDFLNTKTEGMLQLAFEMLVEYGHIEWQGSLYKTYSKYLHPDVLSHETKEYYEALNNGKLLSAFQFDTGMGTKALRAIRPQSLLETANANSLMRLMADGDSEQPMDMYVRYKTDMNEWLHDMEVYGLLPHEIDIIREHLDKDCGVCSSQEGMMLLVMDKRIANFNVKESNVLRKAVAKLLAC